MKEENNAEGLYSLKIDARHYFPDGKITRDVLEALRCRQYAAALAFYLHQGFQVTERSELDDMGNSWPLLRMRLKEAPPAGI